MIAGAFNEPQPAAIGRFVPPGYRVGERGTAWRGWRTLDLLFIINLPTARLLPVGVAIEEGVMRPSNPVSARRTFAGVMCLLVMMTLPACGKSDAEVAEQVAAETAVLRDQIALLQVGIDEDARKKQAACERLQTNTNLLDVMLSNPSLSSQQRSQLQALHDEADAAKEALGCP